VVESVHENVGCLKRRMNESKNVYEEEKDINFTLRAFRVRFINFRWDVGAEDGVFFFFSFRFDFAFLFFLVGVGGCLHDWLIWCVCFEM